VLVPDRWGPLRTVEGRLPRWRSAGRGRRAPACPDAERAASWVGAGHAPAAAVVALGCDSGGEPSVAADVPAGPLLVTCTEHPPTRMWVMPQE